MVTKIALGGENPLYQISVDGEIEASEIKGF
jgi:hypothetical protein